MWMSVCVVCVVGAWGWGWSIRVHEEDVLIFFHSYGCDVCACARMRLSLSFSLTLSLSHLPPPLPLPSSLPPFLALCLPPSHPCSFFRHLFLSLTLPFPLPPCAGDWRGDDGLKSLLGRAQVACMCVVSE